MTSLTALGLAFAAATAIAAESPLTISPQMHHLRQGDEREWEEFPEQPEGNALERSFSLDAVPPRATLELRQQDIKQAWQISINGKSLDRLARDENDMVVYFDVPGEMLRAGENRLAIRSSGGGRSADDIRVGEIRLHPKARQDVLLASNVTVTVTDSDSGERLPARLTLLNSRGALQSVSAESGGPLAVRPGTIYTATGEARFGLPPGSYRLYAGRGFEYSLDQVSFEVGAGEEREYTLTLRREVPTPGYVACDTHIHSRTHSGHGDATVQERMVTLAAEGIELPIATDHNVHVDYRPFAAQVEVQQYFTPVIGNEVTTPAGHFNIFPIRDGAPVPDPQTTDWDTIFDRIYATPGVKVAILNHARDIHGGVRPFGPELFNDVAGENLDGWPMRFNAMEVLNSSATQTDVYRLFHDWMALLNRGRLVTPVGSSDSHDVARHFVGQGRTYIALDDSDPSQLDVDEAVVNFVQGRVNVSYGLLTELTVQEKYRSGELARVPGDEIQVSVRVLGPHWTQADRLVLYANGHPVRETTIPSSPAEAELPRGVKWEQSWSLPRPRHDVYLVALASGPGIEQFYWRTAKPYQPISPAWQPRVVGCSGAVRVDSDQDGRYRAPHDYARELTQSAEGGLPGLLERLADYDQAVAEQAALLFQQRSGDLLSDESSTALQEAAPQVRRGFQAYIEAWRTNQLARGGR